WNIIGYQFVYFYIVCKYLNLKLMALNECVIEIKYKKHFSKIRQILGSFREIYLEISEYNQTYFSNFIFLIWLIFGSINIISLYIVFFVPVITILRICLFIVLVTYIVVFNLTLATAASVNYQATKSYKLLNTLTTHYFRYNKHGHCYRVI